MLLHSVDGTAWSDVELAALGLGEYSHLSTLFQDSIGRTVIVVSGERLELWRWPGGSVPPLLEASAEPETTPGPPLARHGDHLDIGTPYRFPLYTHCGIGYLGQFNGSFWHWARRASDGPMPPSTESWPMAGQSVLGYVTLVDAQTIEYSLPGGEVIAVYEASDVEPPGCA
jgi:hypothetical protein